MEGRITMAIIDKVQGAFDKLTKDDTKMTAAELIAVQQASWAAQLAYIKNSFYIRSVQDEDVKAVLREINDEYIKPGLAKSSRFIEKAAVPYVNLNWEQRTGNLPTGMGQGAGAYQLNDQEMLLDAMYWMQASISAAQAAALVCVRGDLRDFFLGQRDQGMDLWRKLAMVVYRTVPNAIPPQVQVVGQATP